MIIQKPSDLLRKAWSFIDAPKKLSKVSFELDRDGFDCAIFNTEPVRFCSLRALQKASLDARPMYIGDKAHDYLLHFMSPNIIEFNEKNSWKKIKEAWMKAIQLAEEDEAKNDRVPQEAYQALSEIKKDMDDVEVGLAEIKCQIDGTKEK